MSEVWERTTLGAHLSRVRRTVTLEVGKTYPAVSVTKQGRGLGEKAPFVGGVSKYTSLFEVRQDDVVLRTITAFEAPAAVARVEHDRTHVSGVFVTYEVQNGLLPEYLGLFFQTPEFWREMESRATGTVLRRKTISNDAFLRIPLLVPPPSVQARIADTVYSVDTTIAALESEAAALYSLLAGRREMLFTGFAETGTKYRLTDLLTEVKRPVSVDPDAEYLQIGIRSHGRGVFTKDAVLGADLGSKKVFWVEPGDLVINIVFAWEGAVAVVPDEIEGYCASHRFPTYRRPDGDVEFFRHLFATKQGVRLLGACSPGGAGRNRTLNRRLLLASEIGMPDRATEEAVISELGALEAAHGAARAQIERLRAVRLRLLSSLLQHEVPIVESEEGVA